MIVSAQHASDVIDGLVRWRQPRSMPSVVNSPESKQRSVFDDATTDRIPPGKRFVSEVQLRLVDPYDS